MTQAEAIAELDFMGVLSAEPQLPQQVIESIVNSARRYSTRANSTAYVVGDCVVPATANGRVYECVIAGTSGSSVPTYPAFRHRRMGQLVTDGTVTWEDIGPAHRQSYDLSAAARSVWLWRVGQLTGKIDVSADGVSIKRSQLYEHAVAQAKRYGWRGAL